MESTTGVRDPQYFLLCRWHFYAGLFCIPFVLWLACTGSIYLFKPQIESWIDRHYEGLVFQGTAAASERQAAAAIAHVPGSLLSAFEMPRSAHSAVQILVRNNVDTYRVYVHPQNLEILKVVAEDKRFMRIIFQLHGELLMGDKGSMLVELAASWAIVLLITGLYLWWPRDAAGAAGVLYPRITGTQREFWRDLHAVTGFWISFFALFLLVSGLPWAKSWGGILKQIRQLGTVSNVKQDWPSSHGDHMAPHGAHSHVPSMTDLKALDVLVFRTRTLDLAPPVLISPPEADAKNWTVRSDAQNRPLRTTVTMDGTTGEILKRVGFADKPLLDRIIGIGVAAHEGQLFGWPNQMIGGLTAAGLVSMSVSALVLWLRRKPTGVLGAPPVPRGKTIPSLLIAGLIVLGIFLPLLGLSLIVVSICDRFLLRRIPAARQFLGLRSD